MRRNEAAVGRRVLAINSSGKILKAVIAVVPEEWRDGPFNRAWTSQGSFPKEVWLFIDGDPRESLPWPMDAVFLTIAEAKAHAAEVMA